MKIIKGLFLLLITAICFSSCEERVFDAPSFNIPPTFDGKASITIKDFITKYKGVTDTLRITDNDTIEGYVTANDISGNLFKQLVVQDSTAAILINIDQNNIANDYSVGQKVIITCKDFYIGRTYNMLQLGDYYKSGNYNQIGRMNWFFSRNNIHMVGNPDPGIIQPEVITANDYSKLKDEFNVAKLYVLKGVKYVDGGLKVFATAAEVTGNAVDRVVYFNANQTSTVTTRNSSYADFANKMLPEGVVNLTGILTTYNGTPQFMLRSYDDVQAYDPSGGDGSKAFPWAIPYALSHQDGTTKGWIQGYIVGAVAPGITTNNPITGNNGISFASPFLNNTVVLADSANEKDWTKYVVVELPMGSAIQTQVNLMDHPDNLGKLLAVNGTLQNYLGAGGLTTTGASSDFVLGGVSGGETGTIYNETFGTTAVQTGTTWPAVADYTGYSKTGAGAAQVTYTAEGGAVTLRTNSPSSGYVGASGSVNALLAASGASLIVNDIATCGATTLSLSFGSNEIDANLAVAYKINGTSNWVPISYTKPSATWGLTGGLAINLPSGANTIKLKFTAAVTQYGTRVDDITLTTTNTIGAPVIDPDTNTPPNPSGVIFLETCGNDGQVSGNVAPTDYTGWDNKAPVAFSGNVVVRKTNSMDTHVWFAAWSTTYPDFKYLTVSGINTAGCTGMTLSFDATHNLSGGSVKANLMNVSVKDMNTGAETTLTVPATDLAYNSFVTVSGITGIPATSNLQITFSTTETNTMGMRLDNIRIEGVKP